MCVYHLILTSLRRFHADSPTAAEYESPYTLKDILYRIIERNIPITSVVADRVLTLSKEASDIIQMLSSAAADMNLMKVVVQLGQARDMGSYPDPLADVAEVQPVLRVKVGDSNDQTRICLTECHLLAT